MCPHLSQVLQGDPSLHFPDSLLRPPLVRAVLLLPLHQNKALRNDPAARDEAVGDRWPEQRCRCKLLEFGNSWIFLVTFLQAHLACSSLQLAALVVLYALLFFGLFLPVPLLRPSAERSLWLLWPAVILTPTLHVTGRACEL